MALDKCCFCCDLKYGVFTFGVISLMVRICAATTLYFSQLLLTSTPSSELALMGGCLFGWLLITSAVQYVALKGIVQKKAILLHPYIVVLILEVLLLLIVTTILCFHDSEWYILAFIIIGPIDLYCAICAISLYKVFIRNEERHPTSEGVAYNQI